MTNVGFTDKLIAELITKYKTENIGLSGENIELELRFKDTTRDAFESIYNAVKVNLAFTNPTLECSVNVISENVYERNIGGKTDDTQYIRKLVFKDGNVIADNYSSKLRLTRPVQINDYIKYSVGLSKEAAIRKFPTSTNALLRFKIRVSFELQDGAVPQWRLDLTAVKHGNLTEMGNSLKTIKQDLFVPAMTTENLLDKLNYDIIDQYEVEIEYIGKPSILTVENLTVAKQIFAMINPGYMSEIVYQDEIYHVAEYIVNQSLLPQFKNPTHRLKQLSNQVIALSKNTYYSDVYPAKGYFLTEKADGQRAIVSVNGNRCRVLLSDKMIELTGAPGVEKFVPGEVTICDAELVYNRTLIKGDPADTAFTLHLFDCMVHRDENVSRSGFKTRFTHLQASADIINKYNTCVSKRFVVLGGEKEFRDVYTREYPYVIDGLIITEPDEPYMATKNYKWKQYDHTTIDFLAMKCPQKLLGIKPYLKKEGTDLYILYVGINHTVREKLGLGFLPSSGSMFPDAGPNYYPIQFSPSANPLAYLFYHSENIGGQIVELARNRENTEWIFHRVRTDRKLEKNYFGNDFRIAELTYLNYIDPFEFNDLFMGASSYFTKTATDIYTAPNKFKRFVISNLLKDNLSHAHWVIDEAAGRGGDLHRYHEIGVENALFIDVDPTAIAELIRRKFEFSAIKKRNMRNWIKGADDTNVDAPGTVVTGYDRVHDIEYEKLIIKDTKNLTVHTLVADLKTPYGTIINSTAQFGLNPGLVDGIVCNFAIHYMCDGIENLRNLLLFNSKMLRVGGLFIITVMSGKKVFELLREYTRGQQWEVREDGALKYALKKNYAGDKIASTGQMISVLLPFSDTMYDEPLCNIDLLITEASKLGFELELNASMTTYMTKFSQADRALYDRLTDDDRKYIDLHSYITLRKIK